MIRDLFPPPNAKPGSGLPGFPALEAIHEAAVCGRDLFGGVSYFAPNTNSRHETW
jgi:hypothetical protein